MGCNPSRPSDSSQPDLSHSPFVHYPPTVIRPPRYSFNDHNEACRVLRLWEARGVKSRSFTYVVYVINNSLLDKSQTLAQARLLGHIKQLAAIHGLRVLVKCLDYLSESDDDPDAAEEKQMYLGILAATSKADIIRMWDERPASAIYQDLEDITTAEQRISTVIEKIRWNRDIGDVDVKNQIEPEVVAALSRFAKSWTLDEFLESQDQIMSEPSTVNAAGISKLQAQFILQAQVAQASLISDNGATPTVAISFLPDEIPNVTLINIKKQLKAVFVPLAKRVKESEKSLRQDLYTMQLVSLGTNHSKGGQQWRELDDLEQAGMDIIDHLHLDSGQMLLRGPGPRLGQKLLLGSVDPVIDRGRAKGRPEEDLYGSGGSQVIREDMDACICQKPSIVPGPEYIRLDQDA
ncbi:uncharacterized protein CTRU02_212502 [Colletotrichum truncatum]|uniref:Uncharacterized protein n=2 Tax=Colletotrichum truncatum TaxID=5467 RepID=A0ACC3YNQ7_COLTU|nr:uncharacterized protein CTRU02_13547 [Colletotrichum truncatum]XP_036584609.1 uncharacterized protein CTRU02_05684 [Colletotrichum truncatum]KAF6783311.1 hypothetical protein CTRU02_13547 [Colletotrichum truncatum]KAF6794127.1 hypothetical protein CTRU02_05684 [Colletotrichum truncatum]